jgi:Kdo2-lipid IVA lauroyltransferase/acyltransferase
MTKIISYFFQSIFIYIFFFIGRILGLKISRIIFAYSFSIIGPFFKSKKIIKKNLNIFSSKVSKVNEKEIINNMWKNYGMTFIEYTYLNYFKKNKSHISLKGEENLLQILQKKNPVIFVSGHFANFELMSMEITKKSIQLATIYRPLNNIFLNPFMEYLRKKYVCKNQIKKGINGVREAIDYLRRQYSVALMIDQRVSEGEKINFFNKPAFTTTLPAQLSIKFNIDIIPVFIKRDQNNNFQIEFKKRIVPKNFNNKLDLTKELNRVLEEMIINNPNQWIWTHNRWK